VPGFWLGRERSRRFELTYLLVSLRVLVVLACAAALVAALDQLEWIGDFVCRHAVWLLNLFPGADYAAPTSSFGLDLQASPS
jgi:hypothetical protein